jgi:glycosyltransferase involved in cell wall biosynthesis
MINFSVITASFNSENSIKKNIESVNNQKNVDIEHIFIDGGSTDKTIEIIKSTSTKSSVLVIGEDTGIYDALNIGIKKASGDLICILNSDDYFNDCNVLNDVYSIFVEKQADIVYSGISYINSKNDILGEWVPDKFYLGSFSDSWHPPHPGFFVRKKCYEESGDFDLNFKIAADYELMYRFFEVHKYKSVLLPRATVKMRNDGYSSLLKSRLHGLIDIKNTFIKHSNKSPFFLMIFKRYKKKLKRVFMELLGIIKT